MSVVLRIDYGRGSANEFRTCEDEGGEGDLEVWNIADDGAEDLYHVLECTSDERVVAIALIAEVDRLRALLPSDADRALLAIAVGELKERRRHYAATLEQAVAKLDAAIAVVERLGGAR